MTSVGDIQQRTLGEIHPDTIGSLEIITRTRGSEEKTASENKPGLIHRLMKS